MPEKQYSNYNDVTHRRCRFRGSGVGGGVGALGGSGSGSGIAFFNSSTNISISRGLLTGAGASSSHSHSNGGRSIVQTGRPTMPASSSALVFSPTTTALWCRRSYRNCDAVKVDQLLAENRALIERVRSVSIHDASL